MDDLKVNSNWTVLEKLLLAQSVYKYGDGNWLAIARTLNLHRSTSRTEDFFTQNSCALQYASLIKDLEDKRKQLSLGTSDANIEMPPVLKLARELYLERIQELKLALKVDVEKYRDLKKEVEEIRNGKWDKKLLEQYKNLRRNVNQEEPGSAQVTLPKTPSSLVSTFGMSISSSDHEAKVLESQNLIPGGVTLSAKVIEPSSDTIQPQEAKVEEELKHNEIVVPSTAVEDSKVLSKVSDLEHKEIPLGMTFVKEGVTALTSENNLNDPSGLDSKSSFDVDVMKDNEVDLLEQNTIVKNYDSIISDSIPSETTIERIQGENLDKPKSNLPEEALVPDLANSLPHEAHLPRQTLDSSKQQQSKAGLAIVQENRLSDTTNIKDKDDKKAVVFTDTKIDEHKNTANTATNSVSDYASKDAKKSTIHEQQAHREASLDQEKTGDLTSIKDDAPDAFEDTTVQVDEPAEMEALNEALGDTLIPCSGPKETIPVGEDAQPNQVAQPENQSNDVQSHSPTEVKVPDSVNSLHASTLDQNNDSDIVGVSSTSKATAPLSDQSASNDDNNSIHNPSLDRVNAEKYDFKGVSITELQNTHPSADSSPSDSSKLKQIHYEPEIEENVTFIPPKRSREDPHSFHGSVKRRKIDELSNEFDRPKPPHEGTADTSSINLDSSKDVPLISLHNGSQLTHVESPDQSPDKNGLSVAQREELSVDINPNISHDSHKSSIDVETENLADEEKACVEQVTEDYHSHNEESELENRRDISPTIGIAENVNRVNKDGLIRLSPDLTNEIVDSSRIQVINSPVYHPEIIHSEGSTLVTVNSDQPEDTDKSNTSPQINPQDDTNNRGDRSVDGKKTHEETSVLEPLNRIILPAHTPESNAANISTPIPLAKMPSDVNFDKLSQDSLTLSENMEEKKLPLTQDKNQEDISSFDVSIKETYRSESDHPANDHADAKKSAEVMTDSILLSPTQPDLAAELESKDNFNQHVSFEEQSNLTSELLPNSNENLVNFGQCEAGQVEIEKPAHIAELQSIEKPLTGDNVCTETDTGIDDAQSSNLPSNKGSPDISSKPSRADLKMTSKKHLRDSSLQDQSAVTSKLQESVESCENKQDEPKVKIEAIHENPILEEPDIKQETSDEINLVPNTTLHSKSASPPAKSSEASRKRTRDLDQKQGFEEIQDESSEKKVKLEDDELTKSTPVRHGRKFSIGKRKKEESEEENDGYEVSDAETSDSGAYFEKKEASSPSTEDKKHKSWKKLISMIWREIANHRFGAVFMHPIKEQAAPGYYDVIKRPMDLKSIKQRIREGVITTTDEFHRDILLMFQNALMYNKTDSEVYNMAMEMRDQVEQEIQAFKKTEAFTKRVVQETPTTRRKTNNEET